MSILCIGDLHIRKSNFVDIDKLLRFILDLIKERKRRDDSLLFCVLLGDILHYHQKANLREHTTAVKFIKKLSKAVKTFLLIGNHDRANNKEFLTEEHFFTGISIENFTVVDTVHVEKIEGEKYCFVPYVPPGRFMEALETVVEEHRLDSFRLIFAHQEFYGCHLVGTVKSDKGDTWHKKLPPIISGHIHEYQVLKSGVIYPGTPIQQHYHESQDKAVLIYSADGEIERIHTNITIKKVITLKEAEKKEDEINNQTMIIVEAKTTELHAIAVSERIAALRKKGATIKFNPINADTTKPPSNTLVPFYELLHNMLEQKERKLLDRLISE